MANWKKSFVLYSDRHQTFKMLSDEEAGKLIKHLLSYVNDENPVLEDRMLSILFEPIKQTLKRDLERREETKKKRSDAWKLGWRPKKKQKKQKVSEKAKKAVSVNVSVSVSDIEKYIEFWNSFEDVWERKWMKKCRWVTDDLITERNKLMKSYSKEDILVWTENYIADINSRDLNNSYASHRFSMYDFLKQANWFKKFYNS